MDFVSKARKLERRISRTVDAAVVEFVGRNPVAPIEVVHGVLERAEAEIQEIGRGRRVFPFNRVRLQVVAGSGDKESRARYAAVIDGPPSLSERLVERLAASGCRVERIETSVVFVRRRGTDWADADFRVEFDRVDGRPDAIATAPRPEPPVVRLKLTIVKGAADQRATPSQLDASTSAVDRMWWISASG